MVQDTATVTTKDKGSNSYMRSIEYCHFQ